MDVLIIADGSGASRDSDTEVSKVNSLLLAKELEGLKQAMSHVIDTPTDEKNMGLVLQEITICATITATGKIAILGFGANMTGSGSMTLKFVRG